MKRTFTVRATNDFTGEICEMTWYKCRSKYQAIRKMDRMMKKHRFIDPNFNRFEVWEDIKK